MQTFESVRQYYSIAHTVFIEALLNKGMTFSGSVTDKGERITTITSVGGDVTLYSTGKVELFTENLNPYEPYDCGYKAWFLSEDEVKEAQILASSILCMTGDD